MFAWSNRVAVFELCFVMCFLSRFPPNDHVYSCVLAMNCYDLFHVLGQQIHDSTYPSGLDPAAPFWCCLQSMVPAWLIVMMEFLNNLNDKIIMERPCERPREIKPICELDKLQKVRPEAELCGQDQPWTRREPHCGSSSGDRGDGSGRAPADLPADRDEREDLPREGAGNQGQIFGDEPWTGQSPSPHPCGPTSWTRSFGGDYIEEHIAHAELCTIAGTKSSGQGQSTCCNSASWCCSATSWRGDRGRDGDPGEQRRGDHRGLAGLWASLMALRQRMRSDDGVKGSFESTSGKRLEADRHDATTSSSDANDLNPQPTCTTSTTTTGEDTTIKDILSVKNCFTKEILPPLARKLAKAATLTALVMNPVKDVFAATENKYDLVEIACSPTSTLTTAFEEAGLKCLRVNHLSGYNLDSKAGTSTLAQRLKEHPPRLPGWAFHAPDSQVSRTWLNVMKRLGQDSWKGEAKIRGERMKWLKHLSRWSRRMMTSPGSGQLVLWLDGGRALSRGWNAWPRSTAGSSTGAGPTDVNMAWHGRACLWEKGGKSWRLLASFGSEFAADALEILTALNAVDKLLWHPPTSSVVHYVVFLLANLFQVWVVVPAGINTIYGQQSGSKHLASRSMRCMVQNGLWTMNWLLTTSWMYLHGLWSQLATTLGSIWDLASLTGTVDGLKLCLVAKNMVPHWCQATKFANHWSKPGLCTSWCQTPSLSYFCMAPWCYLYSWLGPWLQQQNKCYLHRHMPAMSHTWVAMRLLIWTVKHCLQTFCHMFGAIHAWETFFSAANGCLGAMM